MGTQVAGTQGEVIIAEAGPQRPGSLRVTVSREDCNPDWDRFVESIPGASFMQTSPWARVKSLSGWKPLRVVLFRENRIVGGAQILLKPIPLLGYLGYLTHGPLSGNDSIVREAVAQAIASAAKQYRIRYLLAQPPDFGWHQALTRCGFLPEAPTSSMIIDTTLILDLTPEPEALLGAMRKTSRYEIRTGLRRGLQMRAGGFEDLDTFFSLMLATCQRQRVEPNPSSVEFLKMLWEEFSPRGMAHLILAEYEGKAIAGALLIPFGDSVYFYKVGWSGEHPKIFSNKVVYWTAICWAREQGYRYFNIMGVDGELARKIDRGEALSEKEKNNPSFFKLGFGGEARALPRPFDFFPNRIFRFAYRHLGKSILRSDSARVYAIWFLSKLRSIGGAVREKVSGKEKNKKDRP